MDIKKKKIEVTVAPELWPEYIKWLQNENDKMAKDLEWLTKRVEDADGSALRLSSEIDKLKKENMLLEAKLRALRYRSEFGYTKYLERRLTEKEAIISELQIWIKRR